VWYVSPVSVRIVTDSTADLPEALAASLNVAVVPLHVYFDHEEFEDGVTIGRDDFYRKLTSPGQRLPRTAAPSSGVFAALYERETGSDGIVSIHISPKLSGTHAAAAAASAEARTKHRIAVIDSGTTCLGLGLLVLQAASMARDGATLAEIVRVTKASVPKTRFFGALGTLEYLRRGGRIGRATSLLGSMLHVSPVVGLQDGVVYPIARVRGQRRALDRICQLVESYGPLAYLAVGHTTDEAGMMELAERLSVLFPAARMLRAQCGATLGTYLGPGGFGVALIQSVE